MTEGADDALDVALWGLARELVALEGPRLDVEWLVDPEGRLWVVQCRPRTGA